MEVPQKIKIELPNDPVIPLLVIYPNKIVIQKATCSPIFIAAPFTWAKTWKQVKCPSAEEWAKEMWYTYKMEYYSSIKKGNNAICSNMDGTTDYYHKWSQKDEYHTMLLICGI